MSSDDSDDVGETEYYAYFNRQFQERRQQLEGSCSTLADGQGSGSARGTERAGPAWGCDSGAKGPGVGGGEARLARPRERRWCCCRFRLTLRTRKLMVLAAWVLLNIMVTVVFLLWHLHLVVVLNFFSNFAGLVTIVVAARVEAHKQRRVTAQSPRGKLEDDCHDAGAGKGREGGGGSGTGATSSADSGSLWYGWAPLSAMSTSVVTWDGSQDGVASAV